MPSIQPINSLHASRSRPPASAPSTSAVALSLARSLILNDSDEKVNAYTITLNALTISSDPHILIYRSPHTARSTARSLGTAMYDKHHERDKSNMKAE